MKDILLIHPPPDINPKNIYKSLMVPHLVGYGLLHIAAYLKKFGFNIDVLNIPMAYVYGFDLEDIKALVKYQDPRIVGIELNWLHFSSGAIELTKLIKEINPNIKVVFGGVHASIFVHEIIENYPFIDAVFIGESEATFLEYVQKLEKNQSLNDVPGCYIRWKGKIIKNENKKTLPIDEIPPYSLSMIKPRQKESFNVGSINTCRGPCNFDCPYCIGARNNYPLMLGSRNKLTLHSPEWILNQIRLLLKDTRNLAIQDYIYCAPKKHILNIFNLLKDEKIADEVEYFNIAAKPNSFDKEILSIITRAGIDNIDLGIETGSDDVLKKLHRGYTSNQVLDSILLAKKCGILPKTYWMVGLPYEKDLNETKSLLKRTIDIGGFPRWVTPLIVLPGTELFRESQKYDIKIIKKTYEDFLSFSTTKLNLSKKPWYPEVMTHTTEYMSVEGILRAANELKDYILTFKDKIIEKFKENLEKYYHLHENVTTSLIILRMKQILNTLRNTLF